MSESISEKNLSFYLELPYTVQIRIEPDAEGNDIYFAKVVELPGCMTEATTFNELESMVEEAKRLWLEVALESGMHIPEPKHTDEFSGKFVLRVPRSLHRDIAIRAKNEGVSLNQCVLSILARAIGR